MGIVNSEIRVSMAKLELIGCFVVLVFIRTITAQVTKETFTAAVFEHDVFQPTPTLEPVPRSKAVQEMMKNLIVYQTAAKDAASKVCYKYLSYYIMFTTTSTCSKCIYMYWVCLYFNNFDCTCT